MPSFVFIFTFHFVFIYLFSSFVEILMTWTIFFVPSLSILVFRLIGDEIQMKASHVFLYFYPHISQIRFISKSLLRFTDFPLQRFRFLA